MKVALVHDWLVGMRGGEKCLEAACEIFPDADVFTLVHEPGSVSPAIERHRIQTSFLQRIPRITISYRTFLPLFPLAIERFDFRGYDLVLSMSHAVAKGAIPPPNAEHACYCFSPMRYVWDLYADYFGNRGRVRGAVTSVVASYLRMWDVSATARVDRIASISKHVQRRVKRYYRRSSVVIHPPIEDFYFDAPLAEGRGRYLLVVSALVPYKRIDLAVEASRRTGEPLWIVGTGPEEARLRRNAPGHVRFLGWLSSEKLIDVYRESRALLFPGIEDFGLAPLEAQAVGRPVIGFGTGGLAETVRGLGEENPTGVLFGTQSVDDLVAAIAELSAREGDFDPSVLRRHAAQYRRARFLEELRGFAAGERREAEFEAEAPRC